MTVMSRHATPRVSAFACILTLLGSACGSDSERINPTLSDTGGESSDDSTTSEDTTLIHVPPLPKPPWFQEVALEGGVTFERPASEYTANLQQRMSGGVCVFDVDSDGRLDLFFPNALPTGSRLFVAKGAALHYEDQTKARGLDATGDARGCLGFDLEGDGDMDLLITGLGGARLFRNDSGSFVDASDKLGTPIAKDLVATSAVAFDADGDSDLDLAIGTFGRYVAPTPGTDCVDPCQATIFNYQGGGTYLLLQRDDGTFEDATDRLGHPSEPVLVLLATDLDDNGVIDLFVGNDMSIHADHYFANDGKATFVDKAKALGIAFGASKSGISSMSATDADLDGDGHLDLAESSIDVEPSSVFRCGLLPPKDGDKPCKDVTEALELYRTPANFRWGQAMVDFDHDGVLELFEAMAHYTYRLKPDGTPNPIFKTQDRSLLWSRTDTTKPLKLEAAIDGLAAITGGRGVITADLDADGDLDVVVGTALGRPLLLKNVAPSKGRSLTVRLQGAGKNRFGVGAKVTVRAGGRAWPAIVHAGHSFMSSGDGTVHVGVGKATRADVEVRWPSGKTSKVTDIAIEPTANTVLVRE